MEDKAIVLILTILVVLLLVVVLWQYLVIRRLKKANTQGITTNKFEKSATFQGQEAFSKLSKRPQLERITVGETSPKQPIYKSTEDTEIFEEFYYDDVRTQYNPPEEISINNDEVLPEIPLETKRKLTGTRLILLFVYIIAGLALFISIFFLLASYLATKG